MAPHRDPAVHRSILLAGIRTHNEADILPSDGFSSFLLAKTLNLHKKTKKERKKN